ncbi:MAG: DUF4143 domain-containing protein [Bacilli bacterium]|nr:DUF4143 domain-containing protein [Bacilli bacterium]
MKYKKRIIDEIIELKLKVAGGVVIRGPKWCGKTTSAKQVSKSVLDLQNFETLEKNKQIAENDISLLLDGDKPRLIDEWQMLPKIWNAVRHYIDEKNDVGLYILTGSATPLKDKTLHTGIGRFSFVDMKPMTLFESGDSNGSISLKDIAQGSIRVRGQKSNIDYQELAYLTCRGGWPGAISKSKEVALEIAKDYVKVLLESDISNIDGVSRNPILARHILKSYARNISTIESNQAILEDVSKSYGEVSKQTVLDYINTLKRLYVIEEIEAWNPNLRSKTSIRTSSKKSFVDPSLATATLEISPKELALDPNTFGFLFENLVNRDLSVYTNKIGGHVRHYRDRFGLECDHVINFNNGKFGLIQTKLGSSQIDQGLDKLREVRRLIEEKNKEKILVKEPDFYMVITGGDTAYTTEDGIFVVPIGCLKD